ncbi:hypothetical protein F7725_006377, partial [Dissostichus mawsoni]
MNSSVETPSDSPCPLVTPRPGVEALHQYSDWIRELSSRGAAEPLLGPWSEVWSLLEALWGRLGSEQEDISEYEQQIQRRNTFSSWLSRGASSRVEEEVALLGNTDTSTPSLASSQATRSVKPAVSLRAKRALFLQLNDWRSLQTDSYVPEERLKIYTLLSGRGSSDSSVNVFSELDWKRCIGVTLWFLLPPTSSWPTLCPDTRLPSRGEVRRGPPAPYLEEEEPHRRRRKRRKPNALCTTSASPSEALQRQGLLHSSYAAQLESKGLWHMAIFILMHIHDHTQRERAVKEMLALYCPLQETEDSQQRERFSLRGFCSQRPGSIRPKPPEPAGTQPTSRRRCTCTEPEPGASATDCIINDNHNFLLEFLEGLAVPERSVTIQDWDTAGGVYLDYIRLESAGYELERLHSDVTSLCSRIELLPCSCARDASPNQ